MKNWQEQELTKIKWWKCLSVVAIFAGKEVSGGKDLMRLLHPTSVLMCWYSISLHVTNSESVQQISCVQYRRSCVIVFCLVSAVNSCTAPPTHAGIICSFTSWLVTSSHVHTSVGGIYIWLFISPCWSVMLLILSWRKQIDFVNRQF